MGATALRDDEHEFIHNARRSQEIRTILAGGRGSQTKAAERIHELYLKHFPDQLDGETEAEYLNRKQSEPKAKRLQKETPEDAEKRKGRIFGVRGLHILSYAVLTEHRFHSSSRACSSVRATISPGNARRTRTASHRRQPSLDV